MRRVWIIMLAFVIVVNLGLLVVFASGTFENPTPPLSSEGRLVNANRTGEVVKGWQDFDRSLEGQLVHASFQKNSNSCASCHMTHTAPATGLVFQNSEYNTCMSCHDGSLPKAYNVLGGMTPSGSLAPGGKFSEDLLPDASVSYHLATGVNTHGDAPGSRITRRGVSVSGEWERPFTCASCHSTHGSYSKRHLHYNPNNRAMRETSFNNVPLVSLGNELYGLHTDYGHLVPWFYNRDEGEESVTVAVYTSSGLDITGQFSINYLTGEINRVSGSDMPDSISFRLAHVVNLDIMNHYSATEPESVLYKRGVNDFCLSCHVAYFDKPEEEADTFFWHDRFYHLLGVNVTGLLTEKQVAALALETRDGGKYLTCLTCHFAHGTDRTRMRSRGLSWESSGELIGLDISHSPVNTVNLRFFNPDNTDGYGGRFEACYLCHDEFRYNPAVGTTSPSGNESVVAGSLQDIVITMADTRMVLDGMTINQDTFTVSEGVYTIDGTYKYSSELGEVRFSPAVPWEAGQKYTIALTSGIKSRVGGSLSEYSFNFYTYLEISSVSPEGINIPTSSTVQAAFSNDVNDNTVTAESGTFTVSYLSGETVVFVAGNRTVSGNTILFEPLEPLLAGTEFTVRLKGGSGGILALSGAPMQSDYQWTFITAP